MALPASFPCPATPDGRYIVVRERLRRKARADLPGKERARWVSDLMRARRQVAAALRAKDLQALRQARQAVEAAKRGLYEKGSVWWRDGAPDYNRRMVRNTPYAAWYAMLEAAKLDPMKPP